MFLIWQLTFSQYLVKFKDQLRGKATKIKTNFLEFLQKFDIFDKSVIHLLTVTYILQN